MHVKLMCVLLGITAAMIPMSIEPIAVITAAMIAIKYRTHRTPTH
jgi:hypothetical protein